ncbi:MAG: ATP-binding protein [Pseudomonadota bacterium]
MQVLTGAIKKSMPKSLFGRALLILVLPIMILQIVVAFVFIQRHYDAVTSQMASAVARELNFVIDQVDAADDMAEAEQALRRAALPFGFEMELSPDLSVLPGTDRAFYDLTGMVIAATLRNELRRPVAIDLVTHRKHLDARLPTSKGILHVLVPRRRVNASNPHLFLVWVTATAVGLTGIAVLFLRNQVRPIRHLALAAAAFGRGRSMPFRPSGAEEVRRAGTAFLDMRGRIERQMEQRTRMLSGVSHDLRTPLTRMKLALAVTEPTQESAELARDVDEMERMLATFLDFARGESGEVTEPIDPVDFIEEVATDARRQGYRVAVYAHIDTPDRRIVEVRRDAMKRCLANLVNNAMVHGGSVRLTLRLARRSVDFVVEDDGPGIPAEMHEEVLRPFTRLDPARNQDRSSGVGLGLNIAQDIARRHGGSLILEESPDLGGLRAVVRIPR